MKESFATTAKKSNIKKVAILHQLPHIYVTYILESDTDLRHTQ